MISLTIEQHSHVVQLTHFTLDDRLPSVAAVVAQNLEFLVMTAPSTITPASLEAWVTEAFRRRMDLHFQRTSESRVAREQAFTLMSSTLAEAIAVVKAVGVVLRQREEELAKLKGLNEPPRDEPRGALLEPDEGAHPQTG